MIVALIAHALNYLSPKGQEEEPEAPSQNFTLEGTISQTTATERICSEDANFRLVGIRKAGALVIIDSAPQDSAPSESVVVLIPGEAGLFAKSSLADKFFAAIYDDPVDSEGCRATFTGAAQMRDLPAPLGNTHKVFVADIDVSVHPK